jgi:hypothetical protein
VEFDGIVIVGEEKEGDFFGFESGDDEAIQREACTDGFTFSDIEKSLGERIATKRNANKCGEVALRGGRPNFTPIPARRQEFVHPHE